MTADRETALALADALMEAVVLDKHMMQAAALLRRWPEAAPPAAQPAQQEGMVRVELRQSGLFAASPAQPAGMVLVPREPTPEMVRAIGRVIPQGPYDFAALAVYRAMIAAAPPSQTERVGLTDERVAELLGFVRGVHFDSPNAVSLSEFSPYNKERMRLVRLGWNAAHGIVEQEAKP